MKSLSYKIGIGYFFIICINIAIAAFAVYHINQLSIPIDRILKEKYQNVGAAENMRQAVIQQETAQFAMIEDGIDSSLTYRFHTYKNDFLNWHQQAIKGLALPSEPAILDSISLIFGRYTSLSQSLQKRINTGMDYKSRQSYHYSRVYPLAKKLEALCTKLKSVNEAAIAEAELRAANISMRANSLIIIFSLIMVFSSITASIYFTRRIIKPLKQATDTVKKIGRGNLNQKIEITSDDEIAQLGIEFNKMTSRLDDYEKMNIRQILMEKKKSEGIIASIPVSIIVTDRENRLVLMNDSAMQILGIHEDTWPGKKISEVIKDEKLQQVLQADHWSAASIDERKKSIITITRDDMEFYYVMRQIEITDDRNNPLNIVTLLQDVTRFKNLDRLKSEFMATISHELKTPLTSINMAIDVLMRQVKGSLNADQLDLLQGAKNDCLRLKDFVRELLELSRLESGHYALSRQNIKPDALIKDALEPLQNFISQKQVKLYQKIDLAAGDFCGDFPRLSMVITNIVQNAIEHAPQKGRIEIAVEAKNEGVLFLISDSGPGIPREALDVIFDKFVRIKRFEKSETDNIGLGLAIAREIIKLHQGKIWAESEPGKGSRFYFFIPAQLEKKGKQDETS